MKIVVAGEKKEYEASCTIRQLIELENVETPEYVTVSVNDEFIAKEEFDTRTLREGDVVEFLYFMGGGC